MLEWALRSFRNGYAVRPEFARRLGMVDERYMKQAERLLYGELSAALGIPLEEVQPYIARRVEHSTASTAE